MLIVDLIHYAAQRFAAQEAVVCGKYRLTYAQLIERASRLVAGLYSLGCRPGDRVAIIAQNCHRVIELYLTAALSGLVIAPIKIQYVVEEIQDMLSTMEPVVILADIRDMQKVCEAATVLPSVRMLWWDDEATEKRFAHSTGGGEYEWLVASHETFTPAAILNDDTLFALLHTTGSIDKQKAVMVTQRTQMETVLSEFSRFCFPVGTYIQSGSLLFSSGAGMIVQSLLTGGKQVLLTDSLLKPEHVLQAIEEEKADGARFVPPLVHIRNRERYDASSLHYLIQGGYQLNPHHIRKCLDYFGPILIHGYGITEAGGIASLLPNEYWHTGTLDETRLRSCGRPLPGVTVCIADEDGKSVPSGTVGEVLVRTQALMPGYWYNPVATAQAFRGGWLHTKDLGFLDEEGYLFLQPRNEDPGGIPTFQLTSVEMTLCQHDGVADCVVFQRTMQDGHRSIIAIVEPLAHADLNEETLQLYSRQHTAQEEQPNEIYLIERLPRNTAGKILLRELRNRYLKEKPA